MTLYALRSTSSTSPPPGLVTAVPNNADHLARCVGTAIATAETTGTGLFSELPPSLSTDSAKTRLGPLANSVTPTWLPFS